jgi:hypothetical protein
MKDYNNQTHYRRIVWKYVRRLAWLNRQTVRCQTSRVIGGTVNRRRKARDSDDCMTINTWAYRLYTRGEWANVYMQGWTASRRNVTCSVQQHNN